MRTFNPLRLTEARNAKAMTMATLSELLGVSRQAISIFEKGLKTPSYENIIKLSNLLDVNIDFFYTKSRNIQPITTPSHFRSFKTATKKSRIKASIQEKWFAEFSQVLLEKLNFNGANIYNPDIEDFTLLTNEKIEELAVETRKYWGLGLGPISDITLLFEKNGILISKIVMDKTTQAFSNWRNNLAYIITEKNNSNSRHRFNLAHELGHLIMHKHVSEEDHENEEVVKLKENQANLFAGAFLFPKKSLLQEVSSCSMDALVYLKKRWGISIAAQSMRMKDIGLITENQYMYIFKQLASFPGGRKTEPLDKEIPCETPKLMSNIIDFLVQNGKISIAEVKNILSINIDNLLDIAGKPKSYFYPEEELSSNIIQFKLKNNQL